MSNTANEFWSCWRKEYLQSLQSHTKWQGRKRNFSVGDIVLVLQDESTHNQWPMARVIQVFKDNNGYVQRVKLRIRKTRNSGGNKFWKDLCQKLCCFLNRSVFNSSTRKSKKSELVQDNLIILGEPCVDAPWWSAP